jgi:hypothetical protein
LGKVLILGVVLLAVALGIWYLLGPQPVEKDQYAVRIIDIREYSTDEMVSIANQGQQPVDISGWTLWAHLVGTPIGIAYHFPDGCIMNVGQIVRVHSGPDALSNSGVKCQGKTPDLYWTIQYVWCDANGDTAYLYDAQTPSQKLVDRYEYGAGWHLSAVVPCLPGG